MHLCYFCGYFENIEAFALSLAPENLHLDGKCEMRSRNAHATGVGIPSYLRLQGVQTLPVR